MKIYRIKTKYIFEGFFIVRAKNKKEARQNIEKNCGCTLGTGIHSTLPENVIDWTFPIHPLQFTSKIKTH